ncbi:formate--phosphoribosylaminoimidazolecarboxamide ligase [Candidatus Woesearchaeota archaeon]|nr:formate--phosphoribosylaminoimidazolecarboxamide ligase [Candidatus Woesearchaeota archaeon]
MGLRDFSIATLGSHSALQILKGAKDEGFKTIAVCKSGMVKPYQAFPVAEEIIEIPRFEDFLTVEQQLIKKNAILIPHGSFVAYLGVEKVKGIKAMYFGSKAILEWESNREKEAGWLGRAGITLPKIFTNPKEIDRPVIVKFYGAHGGRGYFITNNVKHFQERIKLHKGEQYVIQEYILGVPIYVHYFYSPLNDEVEIMSCDIRYESNVDALGRIMARDQITFEKFDPSYVVVGNKPVVLRESLLNKMLELGEAVVQESKKITPKGLFGPFSLEGVITPNQDFIVFEISARIVAGTNPYIAGSPYTALKYNEPMSTGRRIAREIRMAIEQDRLHEVIDNDHAGRN